MALPYEKDRRYYLRHGENIIGFPSSSSPLRALQCSKNPGHEGYTPVTSFSRLDLPKPFARDELVDFIKLKGHETVKVTVTHTSPARSTVEGMGFESLIGTDLPRSGSGTAFLNDMGERQPCMIERCQDCGNGERTVSGYFKVLTAAHVVFDDEEAANTVIEFFYDDEETWTRSKIVRARGVRVRDVDLKLNRCVLECVTHDEHLFSTMSAHRQERSNQLRKLEGVYRSMKSVWKDRTLVVVISHPHGSSKHVSIGELRMMHKDCDKKAVRGPLQGKRGGEDVLSPEAALVGCRMTYTAPTCPGSGGGSVHVFGGALINSAFAPHSGQLGKKNVSSLGWAVSADSSAQNSWVPSPVLKLQSRVMSRWKKFVLTRRAHFD